MTRFQSILAVLIDGSQTEAALTRAVRLARADGAALTLVDVIEASADEFGRVHAALSEDRREVEVEEDVIAYHRERLSRLADRARAEGVEVSEAILHGRPTIEVIRMVLREGHDIVIKGAAVPTGGAAPLLKGTDTQLLRTCPCPAWIVAEAEAEADPGAPGCVAAAIDPAAGNDATDRAVLDMALGLADRDGVDLQVVHAWLVRSETALRRGRHAARSETPVDVVLDHERKAAGQRVRAVLADMPRIGPERIHLLQGDPGDSVADFVASEGVDVLVLGTVGQSGAAGILAGSTAETILSRVACSVVAVKPAGFVSPVRLASAA